MKNREPDDCRPAGIAHGRQSGHIPFIHAFATGAEQHLFRSPSHLSGQPAPRAPRQDPCSHAVTDNLTNRRRSACRSAQVRVESDRYYRQLSLHLSVFPVDTTRGKTTQARPFGDVLHDSGVSIIGNNPPREDVTLPGPAQPEPPLR